MWRFPACCVLAMLIVCPGPGRCAQMESDQQIRFWEGRLARDPDDHITPTKLGAAYLQKARESGDFSYYAKAEEVLNKALARSSNHPPALGTLSSVYAAQHRFHEAQGLAEKVVQAYANEPGGYGLLGDALLEVGEVAKAETAYRKMLELAPGLPAYSRMANLSLVRGNVAGARQYFTNAIADGSEANLPGENLCWCHVQKGELHFRHGEFAEAETHYNEALEILPDNVVALDHIAELRAAQGKYDESIALYQKLIARVPRPELYQALGDVYQFIGKTAEARPWHQKAVAGFLSAVQGDHPHYYHHLATFYSDSDEQPDEAVKWARKDLVVRQNVFAWDALAWALYRQGQWTEALAAARKALALGTKDAHLLFHAGMIHQRAGQMTEGAALLREAVTINPRYNGFHVHR